MKRKFSQLDIFPPQGEAPLALLDNLACTIVDLPISSGSSFRLLVKTLEGKTVPLTVMPALLISDLKTMVQSLQGVQKQ
jgi:hypothetical protein